MLQLGQARKRGYLTKREFLAACRWKSPRAIHLYAQNSPSKIKKESAIAFATKSEQRKLKALMTLKGVGVPMASAILTLTNPRRYGVIDIRVWQLLFDLGSVQTKPRGVGFNFKNWYEFLITLRSYARELGVTVRCVEHSLFRYHQKVQTGVLYKRETTKAGNPTYEP
jgi:hypothetical protein